MKTLRGKKCYLRALEPTDLNFLFQVENDETLWHLSNTMVPFSRYILSKYLENSHKDIYEIKQLRLVICKVSDHKTLGFIDLFDFDAKNKKVGVGIVIKSKTDMQKGYSFEALTILCNYVFKFLGLHQVFANILEDNTASIQLFEKAGFIKTGTKIDWIFANGTYHNELQYQLIYE